MLVNKVQPTSYYHKPPMEFHDFEIYYNRDSTLDHVVKNSHTYYEFYFLISGSVTYVIDGQEYNPKSGDVILICPGQEHEVFIHNTQGQSYERYVLWLSLPFLERLSSEKTNLLIPFKNSLFQSPHLSVMPDMKVMLNTILERLFASSVSQEYGADLMNNYYIVELLVHIAKIKLFQKDYYFEKYMLQLKGGNLLLANVLSYIDEHIYETIHVEDITSQFFVSRSHLNKVFSENMGIPLHQFIVRKKLFLAKQDLMNGVPMGEICCKYEFGNYSSFYRAFKLEFGISPREMQKKL